jgi:hypothetical protein
MSTLDGRSLVYCVIFAFDIVMIFLKFRKNSVGGCTEDANRRRVKQQAGLSISVKPHSNHQICALLQHSSGSIRCNIDFGTSLRFLLD